MQPSISKSLFVAAVALLSLPSFAQEDAPEQPERRERKERIEKEERVEQRKGDKKDVQQIIITRKGDKDEKTIIEIKGNKVFINGKDASKTGDVTVHLNNLNDLRSMHFDGFADNQDFKFDFNSDDLEDKDHSASLFTEDANRAMLGVNTDEDEKGAKITAITRESAASKAGLKAGDIITKVGDAKIESADDVAQAVRTHKPGDKVTIAFLRDGKAQTVEAELGKWKGIRINSLNAVIAPTPPMAWSTPEPFRGFSYNTGSGPKLGLSVQDTDDGKGVKVLRVADESTAAKAGLKKDDVITKINGDEVNSTDDVVQIMRDARDEPSVKLDVLRDGKPQTFEVRIPKKIKTTDL